LFMMTLSDYLSQSQITQREFARDVGVSKSHLNEIIRGVKRPSPEVARRISDRTRGEVPFTSWPNTAALARAVNGDAAWDMNAHPGVVFPADAKKNAGAA
jgi:transcriptional regulator with XRE-family HTH domain